MSNYPNSLDTDVELPRVENNITEIGEEAINSLRSAVFAIEETLGITPQGVLSSVADRLNISLNLDGTIKASSLTGLGLVTLPITDAQISAVAAIQESKLNLTHSTISLYNDIVSLNAAVDVLENFNALFGVKIQPHIDGIAYNHLLSHILVDAGSLNRVNISAGTLVPRSTTNSFVLVSEISNDLLNHTRADGFSGTTTPPARFAHNASGISINSNAFTSIPATENDLQKFAEYVDKSSLLLLGSRTQNLYSNGISRASRATALNNFSAGESVVDLVDATTYLLFGSSTSPVDDIDNGDDVILLQPSGTALSSNFFDSQFSQVQPGDFITVDYGNGSPTVVFTIDSVKKLVNGVNRTYAVRINGKNLFASTNALVKIDRPYFHEKKQGALAVAAVNNSFSALPSLLIASPRGAVALGRGFSPDKINGTHYRLYLRFYPTGNPTERQVVIPGIDITGNAGATPGKYTLKSIVEETNKQLRRNGYNLRFLAFEYQGEFGLILADSYGGASFSVVAGSTDGYGNYTATSNSAFPNNVVDNYNGFDALGLGLAGSRVASPPYAVSYSTAEGALQAPTVILSPLKRNFFYVNGVERDVFDSDILNLIDGYGDGYWNAVLTSNQVYPNRVEATFTIDLDLATSGLAPGKTIVVMPAVPASSGSYNSVDYGRFIIKDVVFSNCPCPGPTAQTTITVYDAVHATGVSPYLTSLNIPVRLYFSSDSVGFNNEFVGDGNSFTTFKRHFEIYLDPQGKTFTHERARVNISGASVLLDSTTGFTIYSDPELQSINLYKVSPKLRGYSYLQYKKINLFINSYDAATGQFDGYLSRFDYPSSYTKIGPTVSGKKGEVVRFYDESHVDYIEFIFNLDDNISSFTNKSIDVQLFPTLALNEEKFLLGSCQLNDVTKQASHIKDERQFGNVSEKQLSTSALDFIAAPQRLINENGVLKGYDLVSSTSTSLILRGGSALVNGKIVASNETIINIPALQEQLYPSFATTVNVLHWFVCVNESGEYALVNSSDYEKSLAGTYGSLDHTRIVYLKNPALAGSPYPIESTYLSKIIADKKYTPLYAVKATTTTGPVAVTINSVSDIRRYISNGYAGMSSPYVVGSSGNFRNFDSFNNWIEQLAARKSGTSDYKFDAIIQGDIALTALTTLEYADNTIVHFTGNKSLITLSSSGKFNLVNCTFDNCSFVVNTAVGFRLGSNSGIINSNIRYNYDANGDGDYVSSYLANPTKGCITGNHSAININVNNNKFVIASSTHFPAISILGADESAINPGYYQDLNIKNNYFNSGFIGEDKDCLIYLGENIEDNTQQSLFVNCNIEENCFDKNQMIAFTNKVNASDVLGQLPIPVNVNISKNICGSICYFGRQFVPDTIPNDYAIPFTKIDDKGNSLRITDNNCKYIFVGNGRGLYTDATGASSNIYYVQSGIGLYSASTIISGNRAHWIHVGRRIPSSGVVEIPLLIVENNILSAFDSTFLNDYWYLGTPVNVAIIDQTTSGT